MWDGNNLPPPNPSDATYNQPESLPTMQPQSSAAVHPDFGCAWPAGPDDLQLCLPFYVLPHPWSTSVACNVTVLSRYLSSRSAGQGVRPHSRTRINATSNGTLLTLQHLHDKACLWQGQDCRGGVECHTHGGEKEC